MTAVIIAPPAAMAGTEPASRPRAAAAVRAFDDTTPTGGYRHPALTAATALAVEHRMSAAVHQIVCYPYPRLVAAPSDTGATRDACLAIRYPRRGATSVDEVLSSTLRTAVYGRLDYLDTIVGKADDASKTALADTEIARLTGAWRALLADHEPDERGRCPQCSGWGRPRRHPCSVWTIAHLHLIAADSPPATRTSRHVAVNDRPSVATLEASCPGAAPCLRSWHAPDPLTAQARKLSETSEKVIK